MESQTTNAQPPSSLAFAVRSSSARARAHIDLHPPDHAEPAFYMSLSLVAHAMLP